MIVTVGSTVVPARLIGEGQFLDQPMLDEQMERPVDGAVGQLWIALAYTLEDFARRQVLIRVLDNVENHRALRCLPVPADVSRLGLVLLSVDHELTAHHAT